MSTITPLMRAILDLLDTANGDVGFNDVLIAMPTYRLPDVRDALTQLSREGLVNIKEWRYLISDAGCNALWALLKAEAGAYAEAWAIGLPGFTLPHPVHFQSREALRAYVSGAGV
jgi:hypothetical protein